MNDICIKCGVQGETFVGLCHECVIQLWRESNRVESLFSPEERKMYRKIAAYVKETDDGG